MQELLERSAPLDVLHAAWERASSGRGGTVLIEGEAGIGKTALLQQFAIAHDSDTKIAWGWCEALFTPRPLGPLHDMGRALGPGLSVLLEQSAPPERLFPALLSRIQDEDAPLVLVFEDVHWADNATLDLVRYLGRRISLLSTMVVLSARSDEIGPTHPLAYVLGDLPAAAVTRIKLPPLSPAAVHELAEAAGRGGDDLYRVTAGNPFFVTELLAATEGEAGGIPELHPRCGVVAARAADTGRARRARNDEHRARQHGTAADQGAAGRRGRGPGRYGSGSWPAA